MISKRTYILISAFLIFTVSFAFHHTKTRQMLDQHMPSQQKPWRIFHVENAIHYYLAEQLSRHFLRDTAKLTNDQRITSAEKVNLFEQFSIAMEFLPAFLYRFSLTDSLAGAILISTDLYYAIRNTLLFFLILLLCQIPWLSFCTTFFFLLSTPAFQRGLHRPFLRDDFGLLMILAAMSLLVIALRRPHWFFSLLAGSALALSLAAWHFASFLLLPLFTVFLFFLLERKKEFSIKQQAAFLIPLLTGGCLIPVLWANQVLLTPALLLLYCIFVVLWLPPERLRKIQPAFSRLVFSLGLALLCLVLGSWLVSQNYSQAAELLWAKIINFGFKPVDPGEITMTARIFWSGELTAPSLEQLYQALLPLAALASSIAAYLFLRQAELQKPGWLEILLFLTGLALVMLAQRNMKIFLLLSTISAALYLARYAAFYKFQPAYTYLIMLLAFFLPFSASQSFLYGRGYKYDNLFTYLNNLPAEQAEKLVMAGRFLRLPAVLAFSKATIVNHSKWENPLVKERSLGFITSMYQMPGNLKSYLQKYQANSLLFSNQVLAEEYRYIAGYTGGRNDKLTAYYLANFSQQKRDPEIALYFLDNQAGFALFGLKKKMPPGMKPLTLR